MHYRKDDRFCYRIHTVLKYSVKHKALDTQIVEISTDSSTSLGHCRAPYLDKICMLHATDIFPTFHFP